MITTVKLDLLPEGLQEKVLAEYRVALMDPNHRMTYQEAAWLYGYQYGTIRRLVHQGRLRTIARGRERYITHAAMRAYAKNKRVAGSPRRSYRETQLVLQ